MHPHMKDLHEAAEQGALVPWILDHLGAEEKNANLVRHIRDATDVEAVLADYPLDKLKRIEGPQNGETEIESVDEWSRKVKGFEHAFQNGYVSPPLIVTDFWDKIEIADGNHRHEALLNSGYTTYWTIFLFSKKDSKEQIFAKTEQA